MNNPSQNQYNNNFMNNTNFNNDDDFNPFD